MERERIFSLSIVLFVLEMKVLSSEFLRMVMVLNL